LSPIVSRKYWSDDFQLAKFISSAQLCIVGKSIGRIILFPIPQQYSNEVGMLFVDPLSNCNTNCFYTHLHFRYMNSKHGQ
jgi:hypothetical protein